MKLVVDRTTKVGYALKCMLKQGTAPNWSRTVLRERVILAAVHNKHPLVYGLVEAYQDDRCLYMLLPIASGGELTSVIKKHAPLSLADARFYVAAVVSCIEFLHRKGIVYRDLKPENLMLDGRGYCIMIDFGFAKVLDPETPRTYTQCGTPEYLAPEVVRRKSHGFAVDWWCVGIFAFECLTGRDPFSLGPKGSTPTDSQPALYKRICEGAYEWPPAKKLHVSSSTLPPPPLHPHPYSILPSSLLIPPPLRPSVPQPPIPPPHPLSLHYATRSSDSSPTTISVTIIVEKYPISQPLARRQLQHLYPLSFSNSLNSMPTPPQPVRLRGMWPVFMFWQGHAARARFCWRAAHAGLH